MVELVMTKKIMNNENEITAMKFFDNP